MATKRGAFDSSALKELKQKLVDGCRILDNEGITDGYGHVSVRVPGADALITLAAVSPGRASLDRLVMIDFEGRYLGGAQPRPNEWPIHACIMRGRPDVASVAHTHSKWSTLFSVVPTKLRPLHQYGKFLPAEGPPVYQAAGLVNTLDRGEALAKALGDHGAVLMRAHGDAVVGSGLEQVIQRTVQLNFLGELAHLAIAHGEPLPLNAEELATFSADHTFPSRAWEYHVSRLKQRRAQS